MQPRPTTTRSPARHTQRFVRRPRSWLAALLLCLGAPAPAADHATPGKDGAGGTLTGVVNTYHAGTASAPAGSTSLAVGPARGATTAIAAGDLLLVIQMQGADIDTSDTGAYGDGTAGDPAAGLLSGSLVAGRHEYVEALGPVSGGSVPIRGLGAGNGLVQSYVTAPHGTQGRRSFQVIRVPQFTSAGLSSGLTASAWDGSTGGVLALDVQGTLTLGGDVDLTGRGFRGGAGRQRGTTQPTPRVLEYVTPSSTDRNASKGEGVAGTPRYTFSSVTATTTDNLAEGWTSGSYATGAPGNAGGGATDWTGTNHNAGGGGGGNASAGGRGGFSWNSSTADGDDLGGFGGAGIPPAADLVVLGGGGGAGSQNDATSAVSSGGAGGGMILIRTGTVTGTGTLTVDGGAGQTPANEGAGGGGGGGTVSFVANSGSLAGLTISARGGSGGDSWPTSTPTEGAHGPGGGGSGGSVLVNVSGAAVDVSGGDNGTTLTGELQYGAQPGEDGTNAFIDGDDIPGLDPGATLGVPDLSTSTKTVLDLNGGDAEPGDTLRYTITLTETAGEEATDVSVVDAIPEHTVNFTVVGTPPGSTDNSAGAPAGANGRGLLQIDDIVVAANGSEQIVFEVEVDGAAEPGDTISNTADVTAPSVSETLVSGTLVVSPSALPSTGTKALYLEDPDDGLDMGRALPDVNDPDNDYVQIDGEDDSTTWTLAPALAAALELDADDVIVPLYMTRSGPPAGGDRTVRVELVRGTGDVLASQTLTPSLDDDDTEPDLVTFTLDLASTETIAAGQDLRLRVVNTTGGSGGRRDIRVFPQSDDFADGDVAGRSRVLLPALTVINVDAVGTFDGDFPGGAATTTFAPGASVRIRAEVSDPFGVFDIDSVVLDLDDADGTTVVTAGAMTEVAGSGAVATFEYTHDVPVTGPEGVWEFTITATEGFEQNVTHSRNGSFTVEDPSQGLLVEYLFEDDPFASTVTDTGGNGFDGTVEGTVTDRLFEPAFIDGAGDPTCRYGRFDGVTSGVSAGNVDIGLGGRPAMTVMAWVRWTIPPGDGDGWATIVTANEAADTGQFWLQHDSGNDAFEFAVETGAGRTFVQSTVAPVEDQWQHVAGVYDGSELRIYVDGTLAGTSAQSGLIRAFDTDTELNVGRWKPPARRFTGDIDEIRIHDVALTLAEIDDLRTTTRPCPAYAPDMLILKSSTVIDDPVNDDSNPKRIPGATLQYEIEVRNLGPRPPDTDSVVVSDVLPPTLSLVVPGSGDPVTFVDGSPSSGLDFDYASDVSFSTQTGGGAPFDHTATDDGTGVDPAVRGIRVAPGDQMDGSPDGGPDPVFRIRFRARLE